jgi:hypothetical protein
MSTLSKELRRQLENAVLKAREEAQRGAAAALDAFGVADPKPPGHLDDAGKELRRKLRAHGRQVGDVRRPDDSQGLEHLVHECAYEHWHRMLFARFLAENGVLIEPKSGLDVDLDYCEERARESKSDKWEVAAGFAQRMLPGIFRADDPVLQLRLPAESRNGLAALLASLSRDVFMADDSLGWVYQFWQEKKKDEVNASGEKIGADELPAVTQLFTEDYMVEFLLHNTLGAWWTGRLAAANSDRFSVASCPTEDAARKICALPGVDWKYLRFVQKDGKWTPAAGTFEGWPKTVKELRVLDPCMGSGHFLVFALIILMRMRIEEEGLSAAGARVAVMRDNLFGLELDPRCTQIAAFNLALASWKIGGYQKELPLNLACSGLGLNAKKDDWLKLAEGNINLRFAMGALYDLFQKAPDLGSLINPRLDKTVTYSTTIQELQPLLQHALQREQTDEGHELAVTAQGIAKAAEILASQFTLVATNVPYLVRQRQCDTLKDWAEMHARDAKGDLAYLFISRMLEWSGKQGSIAVVSPQNWLFQTSSKLFRQRVLQNQSWRMASRLGPGAFETIGGHVVNVALLIISNEVLIGDNLFAAMDVTAADTPAQKARCLGGEIDFEELSSSSSIEMVSQAGQLKNPDARVTLASPPTLQTLEHLVSCRLGLGTGDSPHYIRRFWEFFKIGDSWAYFQNTSADTTAIGYDSVVAWDRDLQRVQGMSDAERKQAHNQDYRGREVWGKRGVSISIMSSLRACGYSGQLFDKLVATIVPKNTSHLPAVSAYLNSSQFVEDVRKLDKKVSVTNATLVKVPFDLTRWQKAAAEKYPNGLPKSFSSDPTQWLFSGHPKGSHQPLQVAVARLVGYHWPRQTGSSFPDCPALEPDGLEKHADNDGVVCFSQARDEAPAAQRLRALLADAYGEEWSHAMERKLIAATGSKAESLEEWLMNDFFAQHCDIFHNRPFVWHIWEGRRDGFNVLVNYHKLAGAKGEGHRTLETLTYAYLGDWIARQKDAAAHGEAGADDRLAAALELQGELKKIVAGEPPYDLFIRWKALHQQPEGWDPDINDGVRLNIRPFMMATLSRGKKGCGLFRAKPGSSVKWDKDRGNEPSRPEGDFPWFWKWDEQTVDFAGYGEFDGNRWNACHYTTAFKRATRERKAKK